MNIDLLRLYLVKGVCFVFLNEKQKLRGKIFLNKEGCSTLIVDQDCSSNPKWSPTTCGNLCMQLMQKYQVQTSYYKDLDVIFWYCRTLNAGDTQYGQNANLMVAVCQAIICFVLDSTEITLPEGGLT